MKRYSFNVVEQGVLHPDYQDYRAARIEVTDNKLQDNIPFPEIYEAFVLLPEPFFSKFVELFDSQESDVMPRIIWDYKEKSDD